MAPTKKFDPPVDAKPVTQANGIPALNATDSKNTSQLTETDLAEFRIVERCSAKDRYIAYSSVPWVPWVGTIEVKPYRFENRSGEYVIGVANRTDQPAQLGKHRHRGPVKAHTICGEWNYDEYDWVAHPGDYVVETPGTIHTLNIGANTEIIFTVNGSIEFFHDDDTLKVTMDSFSFWKLYEDEMKRQNKSTDDSLWF